MNPSPTANRSFLHSQRAALISDKVVYATLDSLALKRTRLPLQLLPVGDDNVGKTDKADKERTAAGGKTSPKHSITSKVRRYRCSNTIIRSHLPYGERELIRTMEARRFKIHQKRKQQLYFNI